MEYPKRHPNHTLEEKSITFFYQCVPADWNKNSVDKDYGQDLNLEIAEDDTYRGLDLIVQLKSANEADRHGEFEHQVFKVSTFNYLRANLRVVMIVKYVLSENEAYWILLKDIPLPNQDNDTFTIHIPTENKLSAIDWAIITAYVREVTDKKLAAMRVQTKMTLKK